jgi:iron(III) transport system substrate-binding protein
VVAVLLAGLGCAKPDVQRVVLYCSQDREYAEQILADFTKETGIQVELRGDTEANKSVGLFEALVREAPKPRCDVFWCNEPVLMERLSQQGLLQPYASPAAEPFPSWTRPGERTWQAFAARARILIVHEKLAEAETPKTLDELAGEKWRRRWAMARPFLGTTATHAACLWQKLGPQAAQELLGRMSATAVILPGNRDVAQAVADGKFDVGLTDSDDAIVMKEKGYPVRLAYLDQPTPGTLFLPNTLGLIKDAPHAEEGKRLIDYLLSPGVETRLARGPSGQVPLNPSVKVEGLKVATPKTIEAMGVDYAEVARVWSEVQTYLRKVFRE